MAYHPKLVSKAPPKYSFGYTFDSNAWNVDNDLGPGQYRPCHTQQECSRKSMFPKDKRSKPLTAHRRTPGSGTYNPTSPKKRSSTRGTFGRATSCAI